MTNFKVFINYCIINTYDSILYTMSDWNNQQRPISYNPLPHTTTFSNNNADLKLHFLFVY